MGHSIKWMNEYDPETVGAIPTNKLSLFHPEGQQRLQQHAAKQAKWEKDNLERVREYAAKSKAIFEVSTPQCRQTQTSAIGDRAQGA